MLLKTHFLSRPNEKNACVQGNPTVPKFTSETYVFFQDLNIILYILKGKMPFKCII